MLGVAAGPVEGSHERDLRGLTFLGLIGLMDPPAPGVKATLAQWRSLRRPPCWPAVGTALARETGLTESFVGSFVIAVSTSLPEVVVSLAAVRMGARDMAVANLLGSNIFNIAVLGVDDLLYTRGRVLAAVSGAHLVTLIMAMVMSAIAILGLTYRAQRKRYRLSWDAVAILATYLAGLWLFRIVP